MAAPHPAHALNELIRGYEQLKGELDAANWTLNETETEMMTLYEHYETRKTRVE